MSSKPLLPTLLLGLAASILEASLARGQQPPPPAPDATAEQQPSAIGYAPGEGFRLRSEDGNYVLRISLQAGFKVEPAWNEGDHVMDGTFPFLRPMIRGNMVREWLNYRLSFEAADGEPFVLDAFIDLTPWEEFNVMLGQQGTLVSRHSNQAPQTIFFPEFASVSNYFWSGRERGATVYGSVFDERLDYFAGLYGGSPIDEPANLADNFVVEGRLAANPLGPVNSTEFPFDEDGNPLPFRPSLTAQGYAGRLQTSEHSYNLSNGVLEPAAAVSTDEIYVVAGDIWVQGGPVVVFGEGYYRHIDPVLGSSYSSVGGWGQVAVGVYEDVIGAGVRAGYINPDTDLEDDEAFELEGQVAYFIEPPELVLKARYGYIDQSSPTEPGVAGIPFDPGQTHVATLQLTLFF